MTSRCAASSGGLPPRAGQQKDIYLHLSCCPSPGLSWVVSVTSAHPAHKSADMSAAVSAELGHLASGNEARARSAGATCTSDHRHDRAHVGELVRQGLPTRPLLICGWIARA